MFCFSVSLFFSFCYGNLRFFTPLYSLGSLSTAVLFIIFYIVYPPPPHTHTHTHTKKKKTHTRNTHTHAHTHMHKVSDWERRVTWNHRVQAVCVNSELQYNFGLKCLHELNVQQWQLWFSSLIIPKNTGPVPNYPCVSSYPTLPYTQSVN